MKNSQVTSKNKQNLMKMLSVVSNYFYPINITVIIYWSFNFKDSDIRIIISDEVLMRIKTDAVFALFFFKKMK